MAAAGRDSLLNAVCLSATAGKAAVLTVQGALQVGDFLVARLLELGHHVLKAAGIAAGGAATRSRPDGRARQRGQDERSAPQPSSSTG